MNNEITTVVIVDDEPIVRMDLKAVSYTHLAQVLRRFLSIVDANKESLAQTLCAENGKPITEARAEIGNLPIGFTGFIGAAKHYYGSIRCV